MALIKSKTCRLLLDHLNDLRGLFKILRYYKVSPLGQLLFEDILSSARLSLISPRDEFRILFYFL